jgi:hypothetical protein
MINRVDFWSAWTLIVSFVWTDVIVQGSHSYWQSAVQIDTIFYKKYFYHLLCGPIHGVSNFHGLC